MAGAVRDQFWVRPGTSWDDRGIQRLLALEGLRVPVAGAEFFVCESRGAVVGCARREALPEGGCFVGDVVVEDGYRRLGIAGELVGACLERAARPVYTVTPHPVFAERFGFEPVDLEALPASLQRRAEARSGTGDPVWSMVLSIPATAARIRPASNLGDLIDL